MNKRIYIVENGNGEATLVKAATKAAALKHVSGKSYSVAVANQEQLFDLASKGAKIEEVAEGTPKAPRKARGHKKELAGSAA